MKKAGYYFGHFVGKHPIISILILLSIVAIFIPKDKKKEPVKTILEPNPIIETKTNDFTDKSDIALVERKLNYYENSLRNNFWSEFRPTTRRGGKGPSSINFDLTKYEKVMQKDGFVRTPNGTLREYTQEKDSFVTSINDNGRNPTTNGYVDSWSITISKTVNGIVYSRTKNIECLTPN